MQRLALTVLYLLICLGTQAQSWVWSEHLGGGTSSQPPTMDRTSAFEASGNILVIGRNTSLFSCADTTAGFYARFDVSGNCPSYHATTGTPRSLAIDSDGNIIVLSEVGQNTALTKYAMDDQLVWQKTHEFSEGAGLTVDAQGNIFMAARLSEGSMIVDCLSDSVVNECSMICKFNEDGDCVWLDTVSPNVSYSGICTDSEGNVYATGGFTGTVSIGGFELTSQGGSDVLVTKYSAAGNCQWAKRAGGPAPQFPNQFTVERGTSIAFDNQNALYLTGVVSDSADFGNLLLTGSGGSNVLLAKYDLDGNAIWAKNYFGGPDQMGLSVTADLDGNAFLTSSFVWNIDLGGTAVAGYNHLDILVSRHDSNGNTVWAQKAGSSVWNDYATGIAVKDGNVAVSGTCERNAIFGSDTLFSSGAQSFLALLSDETDVSEYGTESSIFLFPNPSSGIVHVRNPSLGMVEVNLFDCFGRQVHHGVHSGSQIRLDLQDLASGVYLFRIIEADRITTRTQKLILQKH